MATKKKRVMNPYGVPGKTTQEFKDAAKAAGYNPLIASHLRRYAEEFKSDAPMDPTGTQKFLDNYAAGRETTAPKEPTEEKPKGAGDPFNPDNPDVVKNPYVPTPKTSSASEGSGLDYLRDAKGMQAREKDARLSGHTQRLLSERRLKSNLDEMMGKKVMGKDPKTGKPIVTGRTGGLVQFRREEAKRIEDAKTRSNEIRGPGDKQSDDPDKRGEDLGRLIRDKSGRVVGHSLTPSGRRALGSSYAGTRGGAIEHEGAAESEEELDIRQADIGRMDSRARQVKGLWRRAQEGRMTGKEKSVARPVNRFGKGFTGDLPPEGAGETNLEIGATVNEGFHTSPGEAAAAPKRDLSPGTQPLGKLIGRANVVKGGESVSSRLQREKEEAEEKDLRNKKLKFPVGGGPYDAEERSGRAMRARDEERTATSRLIERAKPWRGRRA